MSLHCRISEASKNYDIATSKFLTPPQRKLLLEESMQANLRPEYRCRIEIMLLADMGQSQARICELLGCSHETVRYWITVAQAGLAHKWNERPIGRPKTVNEEYLERLKELLSHSPSEYGYSFQSWTAQWLSKRLAIEFGIEISDRHINRLLKQMGLSTRQRRSRAKEVTADTKGSSIRICDLQSSSSPDFLWSFNLSETSAIAPSKA